MEAPSRQSGVEALASYAPYVRAQLHRYGVPRASVDDLTQEVWLVALASQPEFPDERRAMAWLKQVCRRLASSARRRDGRLKPTDPADLHPKSEPEQTSELERRYSDAAGLAALASLNEGKLDVLSLYSSGELSIREIAELAGVPEATAYSRYRKALEEVERGRRRAALSTLSPAPRDSEPPMEPAHSSVVFGREAAADAGDFALYRADDVFGLGRLGNVLITRWHDGAHEQSLVELGNLVDETRARMGVPLVMINDVAPDMRVPNTADRQMFRAHLRRHTHNVAVAVDILNTPIARLFAAVVTGALRISRSPTSLVFVPSVDQVQRWAEPWSKTCTGNLAWEPIRNAILTLRVKSPDPS